MSSDSERRKNVDQRRKIEEPRKVSEPVTEEHRMLVRRGVTESRRSANGPSEFNSKLDDIIRSL